MTTNAAATAEATKSNKGGRNKNAPAPVIAAVTAAVPMPERRAGKRGSASIYPFDALTEKGMSFGLVNRTAKNMASVISSQNRKHMQPKKDANGNVIYKTQEQTAADGSKINVPTSEPEMEATKHFFVVDTDPKKDPDKATCRVYRDL